MANTLVLVNELRDAVNESRDSHLQAVKRFNRDYEGTIKKQGDTVQVPIVPAVRGTTGGTAGGEIPVRDTAITSDTFVVDQVYQSGTYATDIEQVRQNFDLRQKLVNRMGYDLAFCHELHAWDALIDNIPTANQVDRSTPVAVTSATFYDDILELIEKLRGNNVPDENIAVFINTAVNRVRPQDAIFDATDKGLDVRMNGIIGKIEGIPIIVTNTMPQVDTNADGVANYSYILAAARGAGTFADQLTQFDMRKPDNAFRTNIIYESVFQGDVLADVNKEAIVGKKITNLTTTRVRGYDVFNSMTRYY